MGCSIGGFVGGYKALLASVANFIAALDSKEDAMTALELKAKYEGNSDTNAYTDAEKTKLDLLESSRYRGKYISLAVLEAAHPTGTSGDYATVDAGAGGDVELYIWDDSDNVWSLSSSGLTPEQISFIKGSLQRSGGTIDGDTTLLTGVKMIYKGAATDKGWDVFESGDGNLSFINRDGSGKDVIFESDGVYFEGVKIRGLTSEEEVSLGNMVTLNTPNQFTKAQAVSPVLMNTPYGAECEVDFESSNHHYVTVTADGLAIFAKPGGLVPPGQKGVFVITQKSSDPEPIGFADGDGHTWTTIGDVGVNQEVGSKTLYEYYSDTTDHTYVRKVAGANAVAGTVQTDTVNTFTAAQIGNIFSLTFASAVNINMALSNKFELNLTGNVTMALPTNIASGQGGIIYLTQDATGGRAATWDSVFVKLGALEGGEFPDNVSPDIVNMYAYEVYSATKIGLSYLGEL